MKIAIISAYFGGELGGANQSTKLFIKNLPSPFKISVITASQNINEKGVYSLPAFKYLSNQLFKFNLPFLDNIISRQIKRILKTINPEIVHLQDLELLPAGMKAANELGIPAIVTVRDDRFVCNLEVCKNRGQLNFNCSKKQYRKCLFKMSKDQFKIPVIGYLLYPFLYGRPSTFRKALKHADRIVAVSNYVKSNLLKIGLNKSKISTIYNCTPDWKAIKPAKHEGILLFAPGRLVDYKGFHILIQAMNEVKEKVGSVTLIIAGDGPYKPMLENLIKSLNLENHVKLIGKISFEELKGHYYNADIVILPSIIHDSLSRVILESFYCGKPLIATATGGTPEMVKDGKTGILVKQNDFQDLASAIIKLARDKKLRKEAGKSAKYFIKKHTINQINKYLKLYRQIRKCQQENLN